jgi:spore coat polysaccharide biosynthesis protein SpsF
MKTVAIVQARTGSTRLPRKVLHEIDGEPMLVQVCRRAAAIGVDEVVVATSVAVQDEPIVELAAAAGWTVHRGSEHDVLDRYHRAAEQVGADVVVRVTSDCPLLGWDEAQLVLDRHRESGADLTHNLTVFGSGMPLGTGIEVVSRGALHRCWLDGDAAHHREHVLEFAYEHPERFDLRRVDAPAAVHRPDYRLTVDDAADLELVRVVYAGVAEPRRLADVVAFLDAKPELLAINAHVEQRR